jgi:DNA-binding CsgD family transcriptional regulator
VVPWRSAAATAYAALGNVGEARKLASEEVELARSFGAPRAIGIALDAAGLVEGKERGIALLSEAVEVLESSGADLEHARALTDLGAALRRSNRRKDARAPLRRGLDIAHRCGGQALAERAREELLATGARPRRLVLTGVDALTASERRVAELATKGLTNREIAQSLFVTPRTVEVHLSHAYAKLEIASRAELAGALGDGSADASE